MSEQEIVDDRLELLYAVREFLVQAFRWLPQQESVRKGADETMKVIDLLISDHERDPSRRRPVSGGE